MNKKPETSYVRKLERRQRMISRIFLFLAFVVLGLLVLLFIGQTLTGETGAALVAIAAILYIIGDKFLGLFDRFDSSAKMALKGARAEEYVADILAGLKTEDYFVLNDVLSGAGNIDHLVIAKHGGVFVIETKSTKGRVEVRGDNLLIYDELMPGNPITQVLRNTFWLKEQIREILNLETYITAVLLFTDAFVAVRKPVKGVIIARPQFLRDVLSTPPISNDKRISLWKSREHLAKNLVRSSD